MAPGLRLFVALGAALGCPASSPTAPMPSHTIFSTERIGPAVAATYRLRVKLTTPPEDPARLLALADTVSQSLSQRTGVCALRILFYSSGADTLGAPDIGWANWVPRTQRAKTRCDIARNVWRVELFN